MRDHGLQSMPFLAATRKLNALPGARSDMLNSRNSPERRGKEEEEEEEEEEQETAWWRLLAASLLPSSSSSSSSSGSNIDQGLSAASRIAHINRTRK
jgi:hypothetical protein